MNDDHKAEPDVVRKTMLTTMETMLEIQLQSVRTMMKDLDYQPKAIERSGRRSRSLVDLSFVILTSSGEPMHVKEIQDELRRQFGRVTERDSLSSALGKKAKAGILFKQIAPATFEAIETTEGK